MEWPYRRFVKAYDAYQRRIICDELRQRRIMHIAALTANTNLDGEDSPRAQIVANVELAYEEIIANTWNGVKPGDEDAELEAEMDSPMMRAGRKMVEAQTAEVYARRERDRAIPTLPGEEVLSGQ